jgi:hypothetical protein
LIDEVRAALEVAYAVIDAEFTNQPIGHQAASVLWSIIVKLRPLRIARRRLIHVMQASPPVFLKRASRHYERVYDRARIERENDCYFNVLDK